VTGRALAPGALRERGSAPGDRDDFELPVGRHAVRVAIGGAGLTARATAGNGVLPWQASLPGATPYALILAATGMATANIAARRQGENS
jgi:hypothetical protein